MWNPFQSVNRINEYTPIFSDDNYEDDIEQETERDRAWGEDDDDFNFDDLLEDEDEENPFDPGLQEIDFMMEDFNSISTPDCQIDWLED
ncbi:MAG TPA: hypothetical protein V6C65_01710 [Allocoleopsis sp.]